jgi:L-malate glycosyltransferase
VSPAVYAYLTGPGRISRDKTRLIINGVAEPKLLDAHDRLALRDSVGLPEGAFVVGSVGRVFDWVKRFSDLIRAVSRLLPTHPDLYLLIVGDGEDLDSLKSLAESLGVADRVRFTGYQKDVGPWLSVMDLFALASEQESFGLVLVEAMFASLPVVATNVGGIPNIVVPEETGLLVPVRDVTALSGAIARLKTDPALRESFGRAGRVRAQHSFSAERYVSEVEALYRESLRSKTGDIDVRGAART